MLAAREAAKVLDAVGTVEFSPGVHVAVKVHNVKSAYGRDLFYVVPLQGHGGAWVARDRFKD